MALSTVKGYDIHRRRLKRMREIKTPALRVLMEAGEAVRADAVRSIRSGAVSGPAHVPSRPGEPPNADTHQLDLSIDVRLNPSRMSVSVISLAPYSAALEFGTSRIIERPFMRPALQRNRNRLVQGMAMAVGGLVRVYKSDGAFAASRSRYNGG